MEIQRPGEQVDPLFGIAVEYVLQNEGGHSNHQNDLGGETSFGISAPIARKYGYEPGKVTRDQAIQIYREHYWDRWDWIPEPRLRIKVFDTAVMMSPMKVVLMIQKALVELGYHPGPMDGVAGDRTKDALRRTLESAGPSQFMIQFKIQEENYFRRRVLQRPDQAVFLNGWVRRARREPDFDIYRKLGE